MAFLLGLAFSSRISASKRTFSNRSSTPCPVLAEISWDWYFPPQSSTSKFILANCSLILSGFALGLSTLLIAKIMGTLATWAWLMASFVCGMILSSAAITMMATSVILAPLALMAVNAS